MQSLFQLTVIFIAATALLAANALGSPRVAIGGAWQPIKDLNDPYVKEIANFAVTVYNKHSGRSLKLDSIKEGEKQVVSGFNFRLIIAAVDGTATGEYKAEVWDQPWTHFRNLTSFKPCNM